MSALDFGVGGRGCQDIKDILQGGGPSDATVCVGDMSHEPTHPQDAGGISP